MIANTSLRELQAYIDRMERSIAANRKAAAAGVGVSHTVASHSDTTATGPELDELTDGSVTTLHVHSGTTDADAIHDNVADEISAIDEKTSPASADMLIIEDSAAANVKKMVQVSNLPSGTPGTDSITNVHLANMAEATIKGRADGAGTNDPQNLTATQVRTILNVEAGSEANNISDAYATDLTDGGETTLHSHGGGGVPEYVNVQGSSLAEGDRNISGSANWSTSKLIVKEIRIWTTSTDWDLWLLQNDNGLSTDDATVPAIQVMGSGSGDETIFVDRPYEDEDASNEIHLNFDDTVGSTTFDVSVVATELV